MSDTVYLDNLIKSEGSLAVKLIAGFRGTGKLELLKKFIEHLRNKGVSEEQIIFTDFENTEQITDFRKLYIDVDEKIRNLDYAYLIFYGIQKIKDWEKAVNAFFLGAPADIYVADSNEKLLKEKMLELLPNNCEIIKMYPLSFSGYLKSLAVDVHEFTLLQTDLLSLFERYLYFGGMPVASKYPLEDGILRRLLKGILYESLLKDITIRYSLRNSYLFQLIMQFLASNTACPIKVREIEKYFNDMNQPVTIFTMDNYLNLIVESGFFEKVPRYDIRKDIFVNGSENYYCVDSGLCNALTNFNFHDETALIKNVVYLELLRRGYKVFTPIIGTMTADFFAVSDNKEICIQVLPTDENVDLGKLLRPLNTLPRGTGKILISKSPVKLKKSIRNVLITDFLLDDCC